ncbi:MAG: TusE/DsrC/DsvC family sulfur relay protein [Dehalococcoidia bacterium]|nr:MAG: TusE/DsrC/DsvC family sulfur relay protein [Dehalococcoidia bacterium]UCG83722.1 MAG: TusE/DsrC/DsvC family sulfur relay protein [Dehalococcoidia bacterium]
MTTAAPATRERHIGTREELSDLLLSKFNRNLAVYFQTCQRCGLCADTCHYYRAIGDPKMIPAYKIEQVRKLYQRQNGGWSRKLSFWIPAGDGLDEDELNILKDVVYGSCTMCRRCTLTCPMGIDTGMIMRAARGMLTLAHKAPKGLQDTVDVHVMTGNNMGMDKEEFVDTVEWMEEELQKDIGDPTAKIPIDMEGAKNLWVLNPREVKFFPLLLQAQAKIFHAAGESYTLSSNYWDVTNYALFNGDDKDAATIAGYVLEEADRLGCDTIICTECGHGMRQLKYMAPIWLKRSDFRVRAFVEVVADYIQSGRIKLNPTVNKDRVTYHDPCNQARSGNYIEEPRIVLKNSVMDFVDLTPCGRNNFCCGGGGGALTMSEYRSKRLDAAKVKADQIKATGAKIVSTSCHNCIDQLAEINRHYKLGVKVVNTCELTADAIVLPRRMFLSTGVPVDINIRGYLEEPSLWNREVAQFLATNEGIEELQEEHWRVIEHVRDYHVQHKAWPLPHRINKDLSVNVQRLFPGGIDVVFKIAGLPEPDEQITWHDGDLSKN